MDRAKGSALEWALALLQAPGERHALRQKPLPSGVDALLEIAAGISPAALAEAARGFGETEERVVEAARFYAREVLFFPQADAYRVLGVRPDASAEQIKLHHRLLQHWLHPDRLRDADDAVFAGRVNSAWNRLRSPERRKAYDDARERDRPPEIFDSGDALRAARAWVQEPPLPPANPWWHRLPVIALSLACVVLVFLILRDMQRTPESWDFSRADEGGEDVSFAITVPRREPQAPPDRPPRQDAGPSRAAVVAHPSIPPPGAATSPPAEQALTTPPPVFAPVPPQDARETGVAAAAEPVQAPPEATALQPPPHQEPRGQEPRGQAEPAPPRQEQAGVPPSFERIQLAHQAGEQLIRYMGAPGRAPPPIWNSPGILSSADGMRRELHDGGRVRLSKPEWKIGSEAAVLSSRYARGGEGQGRLTADMVWREGRWLVRGLSLEREE